MEAHYLWTIQQTSKISKTSRPWGSPEADGSTSSEFQWMFQVRDLFGHVITTLPRMLVHFRPEEGLHQASFTKTVFFGTFSCAIEMVIATLVQLLKPLSSLWILSTSLLAIYLSIEACWFKGFMGINHRAPLSMSRIKKRVNFFLTITLFKLVSV